MEKEPHILTRDDDSHWYLIPVSQETRFESLAYDENWDALNEEFGDKMIDNPRNLVILDWTEK